MNQNENLVIYKDQNVLEITLKWFSAKAYFLAFFCVIWMAFLVFWYSMAIVGDAPLIFTLFPLIHVAVGIGLSYYTLCLFLNKTYIDIAEDYLTVHHQPIPWWKGNKSIETSRIKQVYVKEKVNQGKNGSTSYTYSLRAKMKDGSDESLVSINHASSEQMQEIEAELEAFMGIEDYPVDREYKRGKPQRSGSVQRRRHRRDFSESSLSPVFLSHAGAELQLKKESYKIASIAQLDWNDGNTDKVFQLLDANGREFQLFIHQKKALLFAYEEEAIPISESQQFKFNPAYPLASIQTQGQNYSMVSQKVGKQFISGIQELIHVRQWLYTADQHQSFIRITEKGGILTYTKGSLIDPHDFEQTLDLNQRPLKDFRDSPDNWAEEDFV